MGYGTLLYVYCQLGEKVMSMEGFGVIAETAGTFAVVVSLLHVAKQVRASTEQSISDRLCEILMTGASSVLGLIVAKGVSDSGDLSAEEQVRDHACSAE